MRYVPSRPERRGDQFINRKPHKIMTCLFIRHNRCFEKIDFTAIHYVEANLNYVRIVTADQIYMVLSTLKQVEDALPPAQFCRIHRSYVVSIAQIRTFDNHYVYLPDKTLPVGAIWFPRMLARLPILATTRPQEVSPSRRKPARQRVAAPGPVRL
jgi:hypothetical protein